MKDIEVYVNWWEELEQGSQPLWKTDMKICHYYRHLMKRLSGDFLKHQILY